MPTCISALNVLNQSSLIEYTADIEADDDATNARRSDYAHQKSTGHGIEYTISLALAERKI
jgi:hypothetical protein